MKVDFNIIIYETLTLIAYKFMDEHKELFESHQDDFIIYTNYMDSHITFEDEEVQAKLEDYL